MTYQNVFDETFEPNDPIHIVLESIRPLRDWLWLEMVIFYIFLVSTVLFILKAQISGWFKVKS
jgi:hypothetical protein